MGNFKSFNDWDRNNLQFILNTSNEELERFWDQSDSDDMAYALELIARARAELEQQVLDILDGEGVGDTLDATKVLQKFRLKK
jgi:hypothetical protein